MNELFNALIGPSYLQDQEVDCRVRASTCPYCGQLRNQLLLQSYDDNLKNLYAALLIQQSEAFGMINALRYEENPSIELPWEDIQ